MELFTIERYAGDSPSTPKATANSAKELRRMKKLLKEAKRRKRSHENIDGNLESLPVVLDETERKKHKRKHPIIKEKRNSVQMEEKYHLDERVLCDDCDLKDEENKQVLNGPVVVENVVDEEQDKETLTIVDGQTNTKSGQPQSNQGPNIYDQMTVIGGETKTKQAESVARILPLWLANPFYFADNVQDNLQSVSKLEQLDHQLVGKLQQENIYNFFPVQQVIVPEVLSCWEDKSPFAKGGYLPPDICVCAPTGSGKTLAYVLPVIQLLQSSIVRRLEALIIVPTKDLASQVCSVFNKYVTGTSLKVGVANGLKTLQREQQQLGRKSASGYFSHVNILIATPGRLVEHISSSSGFTLQFLRFFVIDEADRLLAEPYFGWLNKVYGSVYNACSSTAISRSVISSTRSPPRRLTPFWSEKLQRPLQKMLFSATLTQNPEKLSSLQLYRPKFYTMSRPEDVEGKVENIGGFVPIGQTPATLQESMYICNSGGKPLVLLYLLTEMALDRVLCFTSSVQTTRRLYLLVKHFGDINVSEFSSTLSAVQRQAILNNFKLGKTKLIICSDAMARGLDLEGVQYVVSYDPPVSSKTYIHRVGRTARAGKTGTAITLLYDSEMFHFKKMLKSLKKLKIPKHSFSDDVLEPLTDRYKEALEKLKDEVMLDKKPVKRTQTGRTKRSKN